MDITYICTESQCHNHFITNLGVCSKNKHRDFTSNISQKKYTLQIIGVLGTDRSIANVRIHTYIRTYSYIHAQSLTLTTLGKKARTLIAWMRLLCVPQPDFEYKKKQRLNNVLLNAVNAVRNKMQVKTLNYNVIS